MKKNTQLYLPQLLKKTPNKPKWEMSHNKRISYSDSVYDKLKLADEIKRDRETMLRGPNLPENGLSIFEEACAKEIILRLDIGGQQLLDVGGILLSAKDSLPYGCFLSWVKGTFPFSERKANYLMNAYMLVKMHPPLGQMKISLLNILGKKDFPQELTNLIATYCQNVQTLTRKKVIAMLDSYKRGELTPGTEKFQEIFKQEERFNWEKYWEDDWGQLVKTLENKKKKLSKMERHQSINIRSSKTNHYSTYLSDGKEALTKAIDMIKRLRTPPTYSFASMITADYRRHWIQRVMAYSKNIDRGPFQRNGQIPETFDETEDYYKDILCEADFLPYKCPVESLQAYYEEVLAPTDFIQ